MLASLQTFLKILGIVVCAILLIGFGVCGVYGTYAGTMGFLKEPRLTFNDTFIIVALGILGIAISIAIGFIIRKLYQSIVEQ